MTAVLEAIGTMAVIVLAGWFLGARGTLGEHAASALARVVFVVATPALLLTTVAHADLHQLVSRSAATSWLSTAVVAGVAALFFARRHPAGEATIATLAASYVNAGNIGLPLAVYLLGDAVAVVPPLLFQLLVLAPVAFTILESAESRTTALGPVLGRTLRNPIIVATLTGLLLAALPWSLPDVAFEPLRVVGAAAAPLALLTFGLSLAGPRTPRGVVPRADLAVVVVLRNLVHPALAWGIGTLLGLPPHALLAVTTMAALPTAQNVLVYAIRYRTSPELARDAGVVTTIVCVPVLLVVAALLS
ncbi:AEC family transporter [Cellulomonas sp. JH27-2]|uniref:AEC family transporter n=1 Tax=Cellulomonas sp. JH27-2 TaxID=2774139 RepID=UPI00178763A2|nr:AEC family transporter [Cellulomonas sp. JH27-2]MBD8057689.1 AEC family transporter [Cellulomonas sp. JH27-2]